MCERETDTTAGRPERGFALVLSILTLTLLTFLGLTLALSTSTEVQIAANYRWSQQALYNAEAGIDVARQALQGMEWRDTLLPPRRTRREMRWTAQRGVPSNPYGSRSGPNGEPSRDFEMADCDKAVDQGQGYIGRGIVLDSTAFAEPMQNLSTFSGQALNGTFTVWVRRPLLWSPAENTWVDSDDDDSLVLTAEGTAPYAGASAVSGLAFGHRAVRYVQVTITRNDPTECDPPPETGPIGGEIDPCSTAPPPEGPTARAEAAGDPRAPID